VAIAAFGLTPGTDQAASAAHLTFGTRSRLGLEPNVRCISCARIIRLLVFPMSPTLGRPGAAKGTKCRRRNTSAAHLTFGTRSRLGLEPNVRCISCNRIIRLLVFPMSPTLGRSGAAKGTKCRRRNTRCFAASRPWVQQVRWWRSKVGGEVYRGFGPEVDQERRGAEKFASRACM